MSLAVLHSLSGWRQPVSMAAAALLVLRVLLGNLALSALCALLAQALLPRRLRGDGTGNLLALVALGSLIPLIGPLLLLAVGFIYPHLEKGPRPPTPKVVPQPTYATESRGHFSRFGAGGALARLRTARPDSEQGSRALLAIAARRGRETTDLLSEALSHRDETLRLLAHNLLARREEAIVAQMSRLEEQRRTHGLDAARTALDLAELHLEFIYLGIVSGGLREMHLEAAQKLIAAIGEPAADAPWRARLLLTRARLNTQRQSATREEDVTRDFERASAAGAAPARVLPWLLESAWRARDYARLRRLLEQHRLFRHIPLIGPVAGLWGPAADA
jgi:polysaccharide biosynthesis protein PelE